MGRGRKICPSCGTATGPRAFKCKSCGHDYKILKGATKINKGKNGLAVEDWHELTSGDFIKVVSGSGPYFMLENGEYEPFGYAGLFKVKYRHKDGLLCYPMDKKNSGACFIYMGPSGKRSKSGASLRPHKVRKVDSKFIDSERRKSDA